MTRALIAAVATMLLGLTVARVSAQPAGSTRGEPLQLGVLQREARDADPRGRELDLLSQQADLRLRGIDVERLPFLSALGQSQYASDAATAPFNTPTGEPAFAAPRFTYDASLRVDQRLYDAALQPRRDLARADLAESQARVRTALFAIRQEVNDAFFGAVLLQAQLAALTATLDDLEGRLAETTRRVREGAAVPGDAAAIEATLLQQRQLAGALRANRRAALARLSTLTGRAIDADAALALPDAARPGNLETVVRARPEYTQFDRARDRVVSQQAAAKASDRPQLSAFGRGGYGRPGLNFASERAEAYALAGVQLQWKAWNWGASARERDVLELQQSIVTAEEAAFTSSLRRAIAADLATIDHLESALPDDDRIVSLRESIDKAARARLTEGVITASEYLDRHTEWLQAQDRKSVV